MAENALLKVLLDEGSYLPVQGSVDCGVEAGLGTMLSRPVSVLCFSQMIKSQAVQKICGLLEKTLSCGVPLLMLFSDCEKTDNSFVCGDFLTQLIRLSGVCPIIALVEKDVGCVAEKILPFADFCIYTSGMHDRTCSAMQALDLPDGVEQMRSLLSFLPLNCAERAPLLQIKGKKEIRPGGAAHEVLRAFTDDQALFEIYRDVHVQVCFARINGRVSGLLWCEKGTLPHHTARFVQFCDCYSLPIIMVTEAELSFDDVQLFVLARSTVPKLCVGNTGDYKRLFDMTLGFEETKIGEYDVLTTQLTIKEDLCKALELLSVKRDVLPPHKHGNQPV